MTQQRQQLKGPLSAAKRYLAATGNSSFGYFGGGYISDVASIVDRIDYSNDTATAPAKGPLVLLGSFQQQVIVLLVTLVVVLLLLVQSSTVDRVDYSNDTGTAPAKGPLSAVRTYMAATSSRANGMPLKGPGILEVYNLIGCF